MTTDPAAAAAESSAGQLTPAPLERELTGNPSAAKPSSARGEKRVKTAQRILGVTQTGKMGNPTRDALRAYQLAASLPVTGDLDADTWKSLHR
jgi:hypothetical protein